MNIKENIETMLSAIASNNYDEATSIFNDLISQKAIERLETYKVDVADQYFNGVKEETIDEEVERLDELSPGKLAAAATAAAEPDSEYNYDGKVHDPQKFADHAKKKFGKKIGDQIQRAADGVGHYPRTYGKDGKEAPYKVDRLAWRNNRSMGKTTTTKDGKLTKTAQKGLKSTIKNDMKK